MFCQFTRSLNLDRLDACNSCMYLHMGTECQVVMKVGVLGLLTGDRHMLMKWFLLLLYCKRYCLLFTGACDMFKNHTERKYKVSPYVTIL